MKTIFCFSLLVILNPFISLAQNKEVSRRTASVMAEVYVAIQCVSDTAFIFMIDDLEVNTGDTIVQIPSSASLDFEDLPDFSLDLFPWTVNDVKGGITWGIENCTFPHNGSAMALSPGNLLLRDNQQDYYSFFNFYS